METIDKQNGNESSRKRRRYGSYLLVLLAGIVLGSGSMALFAQPNRHTGVSVDSEDKVAPTKYQCPMHPNIVRDGPGDCPICGMALVPMEAKGHVESHGPAVQGLAAVEIDAQRQQLIGLSTDEVVRGFIAAGWRTPGKVTIDETRVRRVNVKVGAYVERVYVDFVGKPVRKGQPLMEIYSPELLSLQNEFLLARRTQKLLADGKDTAGSGDDMVEVARDRLRLWDISEAQIRELERTGKARKTLTIVSPVSGVVTRKDVVEGMRLEPGAMPYEITDLGHVWVLADAYEKDLGRVKVGMPGTITLPAFPNRTFEGEVSFIDPVLNPSTRTAKVRLTFANQDGELKPEMFGEVLLRTEKREVLTVPTDAVVATGTKHVVFVALDEGRFQPREIQIGESDGEKTELVSGHERGDMVVTRANFLIDSESRLKASLAAMGGN